MTYTPTRSPVGCEECGEPFMRKRPRQRFCSLTCSNRKNSREIAARVHARSQPIRIHDHHEFGYLMIWDRTRKRYVYMHRLVMELHLGRWLDRREVVHHKDHDPKNNALDNLELTTPTDHAYNHAIERGFGREPKTHLRVPLVKCPVCGSEFKPVVLANKKRKMTCSIKCSYVLVPQRERHRRK